MIRHIYARIVLPYVMNKLGKKKRKVNEKVYYPFQDPSHITKILEKLSEIRYLSTNEIADKIGSRLASYSHNKTRQKLNRLKELGYISEYARGSNENHNCEFCNKSTSYLINADYLEDVMRRIEGNKIHKESAKKESDYNSTKWFQYDDAYIGGQWLGGICFSCHEYIDGGSHRTEQYKISDYRYWTLTTNGELAMLAILKGKKLHEFIKANDGEHNRIIKLVKILGDCGKKEYPISLHNTLTLTMKMKSSLENAANEWYNETSNIIYNMKIDREKFPELAGYQDSIIPGKQVKVLLNSRRIFSKKDSIKF